MNRLAVNLDPSSIAGAILWGVVAGVLASLLLLLLGLFFTRTVLPWYEGVRYKGWDVSGLWVSTQSLGSLSYSYQMVLTQKAHYLRGTMTIMKSGSPAGSGGDYVQAFDVTGSTWEGYITINLQSSDRKSLAFATSLLQIQNRGHDLVGQMVYRTSQANQIGSETISWARS